MSGWGWAWFTLWLVLGGLAVRALVKAAQVRQLAGRRARARVERVRYEPTSPGEWQCRLCLDLVADRERHTTYHGWLAEQLVDRDLR